MLLEFSLSCSVFIIDIDLHHSFLLQSQMYHSQSQPYIWIWIFSPVLASGIIWHVLICTARQANLRQPSPFHPDLHDGGDVCVHVPVQSHRHCRQPQGNISDTLENDSLIMRHAWVNLSFAPSGVDTLPGCCLRFLLLWTNSIIWSYSQWERTVQLLRDITRHRCPHGQQ